MNPTLENVLALYQQFLSGSDPEETGWKLRQAVEASQPLGRPRLTAALLLKMGLFLLEERSEIQEAMHAFVAGSMLLRQDPRFEQELGVALENMQMRRKGYSATAEELPDRYSTDTMQDLLAAEEDPLLHARLIFNGGNCYLEMGQEELALDAYRQTRAMPSVDQAPLLKAKALTNEAEVWRRRGDLLKAEPLLEEALPFFSTFDDPSETKEFFAMLAALRHRQGRSEEAASLYEQAAKCYENANDERGFGRTLTHLGQLHLDREVLEKAEALFARALELARKTSDRNNEVFAHRGLARCFIARGSREKAIHHLEACLKALESVVGTLDTEQGKLSRIDSMQWVLNAVIDQYLGLLEEQPEAAEPRRALLRMVDHLHGLVLDRVIQGAVRPFEKQEEAGLGDLGLPASNAFVDVRQYAGADYLPSLERTIPHSRRDNVSPLPRLVYHLTPDRQVIIVDQPGIPPVVAAMPVDRGAIRQKVKILVGVIQTSGNASGNRGVLTDEDLPIGSVPDLETQLADWYRLLIRPVESMLPLPGDLLVIEPHDALFLLPFAALSLPGSQCLGDRNPILISPSQETLATLRSYQPYHADLPSATVLVVGNPAMEDSLRVDGKTFGGFLPLAGAEREAAFIQQLFAAGEVTYLHDAGAVLEAIETAVPRSNIVHLATHGVADEEEPMSSFLVIAGDPGYVTARRIRDWRMPADLVVLSACRTALGRLAATEGVIGLSRAFFIAGARTVVVSLWPVDDAATASLMERFYQTLLAGKNVAEALAVAQRQLRQDPRHRHPVFWAGFTVIGAEGK